jgi:two-component system, cell cycle sensor histidine kinase and response regulator CckA
MSIAVNNKVLSSYKVSIFYLILLFIAVGLGWFTTRYLGDKARQEILQFNESTILTHSSYFISEFEHIEREVKVLSGSPIIASALISRKDEDIANANSVLDRYNSGLGSSVSYLLDSNGMTIASSNRNDSDSFVGKSYGFRPYFIQASKDTPGRYFALGVTSLKRGFYASYSVKDSKGQIIGVVVIKKDIDEKEADLSRYPYLFLVDPNGIIFLSSRKEMTFKSLWPISRETRLALLESGQFGVREFDTVLPGEVVDGMEIKIDGRDYIASRKVINPEGWSTVIMTSAERILLHKLVGVIISIWVCTLIVVPMIINYRTSRSAKMLRASETRYRELFDNTSSGVAIYEVRDGGKDFILKDFNKAGERIDGAPKEDIIGKSIHEVRPGIKEFGLLDVFERVWRTGIPEHHPASFYHDQKLAVWFENFVYKLPTGEMVDVYDDITDRMRAEEDLRKSEEKYRRIVETANEGICAADADYLVTYVNKKMADMLGYLPEEIIGKPLTHFFFPEDLADHQEKWSHRIQGLGETYERRFRRSDGGECWTNVSVTVIRTEDGRFMGSFAMLTDITERKQAEEALLESENKFRSFAEQAITGINIIQDGVFKYVNPKFAEMFGYTVEECLNGMPFKNLVYAEDLATVEEQVGRRISGGTGAAHYTFRGLKRNGQIFHVEIYGSAIVYQGKPASTGTILDITERKRAEKALAESEEKYRRIVETANEGICAADADNLVTYVNQKMADMLGYLPEEIIGKPLTHFFFPEDLADHQEKWSHRIQGLGETYERRFRRSDGGECWTNISVTVIRSEDGRFTGAFGMLTDITERKQAEIALRMSEERFSRFFRASPVGTSILRLIDNKFADVNDVFLGLFGYTREEVIGQNPLDLGIWPDPEDRVKMVEILKKQGRVKDFETRFRWKSGEIGDVLFSGEVIEVAGQQYLLGLTHDITERKRADKERKKLEQQLFQAQKIESVGRLAGGVAHDFNNMLGVIIGRAELALNTHVSADQLQHNLKEILKAGLRSADLTRQLLAFARKQTAILQILDLNSTIPDMLKMLRRLIGEDIGLSWQPGPDLWKVKIDPSQVDQILANLVVNARDAISGIGSITMRSENVVIDDSISTETPEFIPGEYVLLTVSDSGTGMSQEVRENIFEPFFTTKEVGKGTGLGLSTVYGIVKQNDGFIYVASEPGKGTTFKIYLPRFKAETAQVPPEEAAGMPPAGTETILLVEDDEAILNLGKMILENLGYMVLAAQTPVDAVRLAEVHPGGLHLLITDVVMPEMNGRELAERLGAIRPNLKCLYMSGYTADVIAHRGIIDQGVSFIQKPFLSDDFAARVRQVLDHLE